MYLWLDEKDNPAHSTPYAVYALCILNVIIFVLTFHGGDFRAVIEEYGVLPSRLSPQDALSSMFLHANYWHLIGNMAFLWVFGDNVEDVLGWPSFFLCYLSCGFAAAAGHVALNLDSEIPMIGASGAISGVLGMYFCFFRNAHIDLQIYFREYLWKTIHVSGLVAIGAWVAYQLSLALLALAFDKGSFFGVAVWAHLGGFAGGVLLGLVASRLGASSAISHRVLKFERFYEAPVWCPACGFKEADREFRAYECVQCGAKYEIIDKRPLDTIVEDDGFKALNCSAFVYFKREDVALAVKVRYHIMAALPLGCMVLGLHRYPKPPHPSPLFEIKYAAEDSSRVVDAIEEFRGHLPAFFPKGNRPLEVEIQQGSFWKGRQDESAVTAAEG